IFMWTPPHFWALALFRSKDYEDVGVPMLPVVAGRAETGRQILVYSLLLVAVTLVPGFIGLGGLLYTAVTALLGLAFLVLAFRVWRNDEPAAQDKAAKRLF